MATTIGQRIMELSKVDPSMADFYREYVRNLDATGDLERMAPLVITAVDGAVTAAEKGK